MIMNIYAEIEYICRRNTPFWADAYCIFIRDIRARLYIDRDSLLTVNFLHLSRRHTLAAGLLELRIG